MPARSENTSQSGRRAVLPSPSLPFPPRSSSLRPRTALSGPHTSRLPTHVGQELDSSVLQASSAAQAVTSARGGFASLTGLLSTPTNLLGATNVDSQALSGVSAAASANAKPTTPFTAGTGLLRRSARLGSGSAPLSLPAAQTTNPVAMSSGATLSGAGQRSAPSNTFRRMADLNRKVLPGGNEANRYPMPTRPDPNSFSIDSGLAAMMDDIENSDQSWNSTSPEPVDRATLDAMADDIDNSSESWKSPRSRQLRTVETAPLTRVPLGPKDPNVRLSKTTKRAAQSTSSEPRKRRHTRQTKPDPYLGSDNIRVSRSPSEQLQDVLALSDRKDDEINLANDSDGSVYEPDEEEEDPDAVGDVLTPLSPEEEEELRLLEQVDLEDVIDVGTSWNENDGLLLERKTIVDSSSYIANSDAHTVVTLDIVATDSARQILYDSSSLPTDIKVELKSFFTKVASPNMLATIDAKFEAAFEKYVKSETEISGMNPEDIVKPSGGPKNGTLVVLNHPTYSKTGTGRGETLDPACATTRQLLMSGVTKENSLVYDAVNRRCHIRYVVKGEQALRATTLPKTWSWKLQLVHYQFMIFAWVFSLAKVGIVCGGENRKLLVPTTFQRITKDMQGTYQLSSMYTANLEDGTRVNFTIFRFQGIIRKVLIYVWHPEYANGRASREQMKTLAKRFRFAYQLCGTKLPEDAFTLKVKARGQGTTTTTKIVTRTTRSSGVAPVNKSGQNALALLLVPAPAMKVQPEQELCADLEPGFLRMKHGALSRFLAPKTYWNGVGATLLDRNCSTLMTNLQQFKSSIRAELELEKRFGPAPWQFLHTSLQTVIRHLLPSLFENFELQKARLKSRVEQGRMKQMPSDLQIFSEIIGPLKPTKLSATVKVEVDQMRRLRYAARVAITRGAPGDDPGVVEVYCPNCKANGDHVTKLDKKPLFLKSTGEYLARRLKCPNCNDPVIKNPYWPPVGLESFGYWEDLADNLDKSIEQLLVIDSQFRALPCSEQLDAVLTHFANKIGGRTEARKTGAKVNKALGVPSVSKFIRTFDASRKEPQKLTFVCVSYEQLASKTIRPSKWTSQECLEYIDVISKSSKFHNVAPNLLIIPLVLCKNEACVKKHPIRVPNTANAPGKLFVDKTTPRKQRIPSSQHVTYAHVHGYREAIRKALLSKHRTKPDES